MVWVEDGWLSHFEPYWYEAEVPPSTFSPREAMFDTGSLTALWTMSGTRVSLSIRTESATDVCSVLGFDEVGVGPHALDLAGLELHVRGVEWLEALEEGVEVGGDLADRLVEVGLELVIPKEDRAAV